MPIRKDVPPGTKPIASEEQAAAAAESVCSRLQYDHNLTEPVRRTYVAFMQEYAREAAQLQLSNFEEEVERVISAGSYSSDNDINALKAEVLEYLNPNLVKEARLNASRRHSGLR